MANTILLRANGYDPISKEATASGSITPGMLIERNGSVVQAHSTTGGNALPMFALEQDYIGDEISDAYADAENVKFIVARPGDEIYAVLTSGATSFSVGDYLESDGNGALKASDWASFSGGDISGTNANIDSVVAAVLEATTGTSGSTARIKVEVI